MAYNQQSNSKLSESHLNADPQFQAMNRGIVKQSLNNSTDFCEAFVKIHELLNNPAFRGPLMNRQPQLQTWNRVLLNQLDDDRYLPVTADGK